MFGSVLVNRIVDFVEFVGWLVVYVFLNSVVVNVSVILYVELVGGSGVFYIWFLEEGLSWEILELFIIYVFFIFGLYFVMVIVKN